MVSIGSTLDRQSCSNISQRVSSISMGDPLEQRKTLVFAQSHSSSQYSEASLPFG